MQKEKTEFQEECERCIISIWNKKMHKIKDLGTVVFLDAHRPNGYVDGFRDALNAIADVTGIDRI